MYPVCRPKPRCKLTDGFVNEEARGLLCKKKVICAGCWKKTKVAQEKTTRQEKMRKFVIYLFIGQESLLYLIAQVVTPIEPLW
jgi:hypothetical protein